MLDLKSCSGDMAEPHAKTAGIPLQYANSGASSAPVNPTEEALAAFKDIKMKRKFRFVFFRIDGLAIVVDNAGAPSATHVELLASLPHADCRYVIYDHDVQLPDGRRSSKLYFLLWSPPSASPNHKMGYAHGKSAFRAHCDGCLDINASDIVDVQAALGLATDDDDDDDEF
ncbi:hypothetical protein DYB25_013867 [Aphanomyces astaci]|uniref:ADF-H domain-containing protein n=2 Tax=Aphanomyces astaci TaxID=112090 RepID=A0A397ENN3_APHAT|nr:hypothetical protein DYB25_013867 [Aphanomyces astaci]RHY54634.1 hypothetical protein DYB30_011155 [Aphanomyces astaci]RHY60175.1 hypothetical protein DYB34_011021 [Aphanomyces astaci]RHY92819.1 hypothetical protein DYB31_008421 [Aphanomyces astaci]RHY97521.1 hypothetical protein DYB26_011136 [Aphanomyces astaci]